MTHGPSYSRANVRRERLRVQKRTVPAGPRGPIGRVATMNTITVEQQQRIVELLREGHSARDVERITGHRRETVLLYGRLAGILPVRTSSRTTQALAA
jgi:hypothetical protein